MGTKIEVSEMSPKRYKSVDLNSKFVAKITLCSTDDGHTFLKFTFCPNTLFWPPTIIHSPAKKNGTLISQQQIIPIIPILMYVHCRSKNSGHLIFFNLKYLIYFL
jgi:hypothetical protein